MKERPILLNGEMVRAILDGRKTQTRGLVKPQPFDDPKWGLSWAPRGVANNKPIYCERNANFNPITKAMLEVGAPLGAVGDRLWVRETFYWEEGSDKTIEQVAYRASTEMPPEVKAMGCRWTPSIHMPRWASRIDLEITRVWVERVQDITEEDAKKEGIQSVEVGDFYGWKNYQFKTAHPRHGSIITDEEHRIHAYQSPVVSFKSLWQSIYGTWDANPFVWAYEFRRVKP